MQNFKGHILKSSDRGLAEHGWLKSFHTFSFADYYNPEMMNFGPLRVINEDWIDGGTGFPTHPHQDMEIITYIIEGSLAHKDSTGTEASIHPGDVQRMTAGTGIRHSEFNHYKDKKTHLLQIWIMPDKKGYAPGYEQKSFTEQLATGNMILVASNKGKNGSVSLNQDLNLYALKSSRAGEQKMTTEATNDEWRMIWVQVVSGEVKLENSETLKAGDAMSGLLSGPEVKLSWAKDSEFLLFDMKKFI